MTNPIAVSQRAREFAARWMFGAWPEVSRDVLAGTNDDNTLAQAFARFEAEIRADERERVAKVADEKCAHLTQLSTHGRMGNSGRTLRSKADTAREIATAIRNQKDHDHEPGK